MSKLRVCAYCRVSTDNDEQLTSYENQKSYFEQEAISKGHTYIDTYADKGLTGTKLNNRKEFNRMLYDAGLEVREWYPDKNDKRVNKKVTTLVDTNRKPLFDEIWIKNTSRFARNTLSF